MNNKPEHRQAVNGGTPRHSTIGASDDLSTFVIENPEDLQSLQPFCQSLRLSAEKWSASFSYHFLVSGWTILSRDTNAWLKVIGVRRADELIAIWPLYLNTKDATLRHLGSGSNEEYSGLIGRTIDLAIASAFVDRALSECDILEVHNLLPSDPLGVALRKKSHAVVECASPVITVGTDAAAWRASKSKSFRQSIRNARNRLAKTGDLKIGLVAAEEAQAFSKWLFETKRSWLDDRGKGQTWVHTLNSEHFFADVMARADSGVAGYALTLDGRYIAGCILLLGTDIEFFIVATDPEYAAYSPGQQILDGLVDLAAERGSRIDLRLTSEDYKLRWSDTLEKRYTYFVSGNRRGRQIILLKRLKLAIHDFRKMAGQLRRRLKRS